MKNFTLIAIVILLSFVASAQDNLIDNKGTEFWVAFNVNYGQDEEDGINRFYLFISSDVSTSGYVEIPGIGFYEDFNVLADDVKTIELPYNTEVLITDGIENKGVHIISNDEIVVYGLNQYPASTDAFMAVPEDAIGTRYLIGTYEQAIFDGDFEEPFTTTNNRRSSLGVVAVEDNTNVIITPSVSTQSYVEDNPFLVTLNEGEVYQLLSENGDDLTGTLIEADKKVSVYGGHNCTSVPDFEEFCDHLVEQLPPTEAWGKQFFTASLETRTGGDLFRVIASEDDTEVYINGSLVATLNTTDFYEVILSSNTFNEVNTSKPSLLLQFSLSTEVDNTISDPFMIVIPPFEQFSGSTSFSTPAGSSNITDNFVNIITPSAGLGVITLDNGVIPPTSFEQINNTSFYGTRLSISPGKHTLEGANIPFGAFIYGFGDADSYGYPAGMIFSSVAIADDLAFNLDIVSSNVGEEVCLTATLTDEFGTPVSGVRIDILIEGVNNITDFVFTDENGVAEFCYTSEVGGTDTVTASTGTLEATTIVNWDGGDVINGTITDVRVRNGDGEFSDALENFPAANLPITLYQAGTDNAYAFSNTDEEGNFSFANNYSETVFDIEISRLPGSIFDPIESSIIRYEGVTIGEFNELVIPLTLHGQVRHNLPLLSDLDPLASFNASFLPVETSYDYPSEWEFIMGENIIVNNNSYMTSALTRLYIIHEMTSSYYPRTENFSAKGVKGTTKLLSFFLSTYKDIDKLADKIDLYESALNNSVTDVEYEKFTEEYIKGIGDLLKSGIEQILENIESNVYTKYEIKTHTHSITDLITSGLPDVIVNEDGTASLDPNFEGVLKFLAEDAIATIIHYTLMEALYKGWTTEEFERTINAIANNEFYPSDNNTLLTTLISEYPTNLSCNEVYDNQIFDFGVFNQVSTINYNSGTFPGSVDVLVNELGDCLDLYIDNIDNAASNASGASTVASYSAAAVGVTGVGISIAAYLKALAGILKLAEVGLNTASIYNSWYGYQRVGASYYRTMHHDLLDDLLPTLSERLLPSEPCPIEYFNDALGEYNVSKANYTTSINNIRQAVLSNDMSNMYNLFDILTDSDSILTKSLIKCSHPVKSIYNVAIDSISSFQGEYIETLLIDTGDDITERAALLTYIMAFVFDPNSQEVKDSIVITMDEVLENLDDIYVGYEEIYNLTNELPCYAYLSLNPNREFINVDMFQDMTIDLVNVSPLTSEDLYAKVFIYDFGTYTEYDSIYVGNLNPNETTSVNFDFSGVIVDSILLYEITFYSPNTVVQGVGGTLHNENINRILDCSDFLDEGYSHLFILEDSLEAGDTLLAFPQSIEENVTYEWYLDGNLIGTEDTINYIMSGGDNVELMLTATLDSCTYETTTIINRTVNCNFVGVGVDIYCEDMDTEEIDDDVFYFTLEPNGDNFSGSYTVSGDVDIPNIPYGVSPMAYGPYLTGTVLNITLTDDADPTCSFSTTIEYVCGGGGVPTVSEWGLIILALLLLNLGVLYIRQTEIRIEQA